MKKVFLIVFAALVVSQSQAQVTLEWCYGSADQRYPILARRGLIDRSERFDLASASKGWIPQIGVNAKASYQSDVASIPVSIPGMNIPTLNKDQYQATLEGTQTLWDGGGMRAQKRLARSGAEVDRASLDVDMYALRDRVNTIYFGILLIDEQLRLNSIYIKNLGVNLASVQAMETNGVVGRADVSVVEVEILKARQDSVSLVATREAYVAMLSEMTGDNLAQKTFARPAAADQIQAEFDARPELLWFQNQEKQIDDRKLTINTRLTPTFNAYAQAGYGYPGLNMLAGRFSTWFTGGLQMRWNIGGFYTLREERGKLAIAARNVDINRELFIYNLRLTTRQIEGEIEKYRQTIALDNKIVTTKEQIEAASKVKMQTGVMTVSDFMRDVLSTESARQTAALNDIQRLSAIYKLKYTLNK